MNNHSHHHDRRQGAHQRGGSRATAFALAWALLATTAGPASAAVTGPLVSINAITSAAGFQHPGIGVSAANLANARDKVRADIEPWKSYYEAMAASKYASKTLQSRNKGAVLDQPGNNAYNVRSTQDRLIEDSWGAYTQAVLYYITGDNTYRANAMKILRIWSNMDPAKYGYFPDAHIHSGIPLYRLLSAAEIMRYTSADTSYTAYSLAWTDTDTSKLSTNLIAPMLATFLYNNEHYMNQHSYPLGGALASYIFTDNRARYAEGVEWFTVNASSRRQDINGALAPIFRLIDKDDPLNHYGYSFVQGQEMGRDQAHAGGDMDTLTGLARMVSIQGTRVDPADGTPSTASNAVTPYRFLGNRLLAGANAYAQFMLGYETPWIDVTGGSAKISPAYRGRLSDVTEINELYTVYKYGEGVDVEAEAPYLAQARRQMDGPLYYRAGGLSNYWGGIDTGPEFWLSFPAQLAGQAPPPVGDANIQVEQKGVFLDAEAVIQTEGGRTFARIAPSAGGSTVAVHDLHYQDRAKYSPIGLMMRTSATSTMEISASQTSVPFRRMTVPNTHGQWRYITYDMAASVTAPNPVGDHIAYYKLIGDPQASVDFDHVNLLAAKQLTPPQFAQGQTTSAVAVQGEPFSATYAATDANPAEHPTYEAVGLPDGAHLDPASGQLTWTPSAGQAGTHKLTIVANDGVAYNVLDVTIRVGSDRADAYRIALDGYSPQAVYTNKSLPPFLAIIEQVKAAMPTATEVEFGADLVKLQGAVKALELLNPLLKDDRSLNYPSMVTSNLYAQVAVFNLVDGDYNSTTGDRKIPFHLDFGPDYSVSASAFGIRARYNFANRSQGANVYGSSDLLTWTRLTRTETTDTSARDFAIETLPVIAGLENQRFRYIRVQVDHPGPATDPAYPGLSSFSELRIHGVRHDMAAPAFVDVTGSVRVLQSGLSVNRFTSKYTGTVTFTNTSEATFNGPLHVRLDGLSAGVTLDNKTAGPDGAPYITVPDSALAPGASVTVTTTFSNPAKASIVYTPSLISGKL